jgi:hypothetical protein
MKPVVLVQAVSVAMTAIMDGLTTPSVSMHVVVYILRWAADQLHALLRGTTYVLCLTSDNAFTAHLYVFIGRRTTIDTAHPCGGHT